MTKSLLSLPRIVVTGGRDFTNRTAVFAALDYVHRTRGMACLINGQARGADALSSQWAHARGVPLIEVPALWDAYHKAAGPRRNRWMCSLTQPTGAVAFPGGSGTADMLDVLDMAGVPVWQPERP